MVTFRHTVSAIALAGSITAQPSLAQDAGADAAAAAEDRIVVTGTLIPGLREDAPAPVDVISLDELARQGMPSLMDIAKRLPVSSGVLGDSSQFDPRSQFNQGAASVNLRGLGPQRTLVLLNGRRLVASGAGNMPLVDINLIPGTALGRIEILKDGAGATYGSDAIAGVVNFITRDNQQGFVVGGDYRYIDGSSGDWNGGLSWGGALGPARIFLSAGYQQRGELSIMDRDFAWRPFTENPQGGFTGGGNPGNFDFNGTVNGTRFVADAGCAALGGFRSTAGSSADLCNTSFLGFTNLVEPEKRYQLFADVALDVGDTSQLRLTALYGRGDTVLHTSPSFLPTIAPSANAAFGGTGLFTIPSYAPALIDYCARFGAAAGCAVDGNGLPTAPALAFPVRFRPVLTGGNPLFDDGAAQLDYEADSWQFTSEFVTDLGDDLTLTAALTFSEYDRFYEVGDSYVDYLQNALAGFGGADCAFADPATRAGLTTEQLAAIAGTQGCTWFNPFSTGVAANVVTGAANPNYAGNGSAAGLSTAPGAGLVNDAATFGHIYNVWGRTANTQQWVADLVLAGGTGLALSGGEMRFAGGAQFRRDRSSRSYEGGNNLDLFPCPGTVLDADATCSPETGALGFIGGGRDFAVASEVWALFGELQLPVTRTLTAQISARYEDYGGAIGATFDPQFRLRFTPTDWLTLRGGVGTTFRGPTPNVTNASSVILTFIGGGFRAVDILANPTLDPETATTWNAGAIIDTGGLRLSADYWSYDFSGAIENEPVGGIVAALFGASGTANCGNPAYAGLQARFTFAGGVCGSGNVQRLATFPTNSSDVSTRGLDLSASYDWQMGDALLQVGANGSYVFAYEVSEVVVEGISVQPAFDAVGLLNFQTTAYPLPRWKGQGWAEAQWGSHGLRLQVNLIDGYTDQRGADVFGPNNSALAGASVTAGKEIGRFTTVDAIWRWQMESGTTLSLTLANILDEEPPFVRLEQNFDPFTADPLGFTARIGVSTSF